MRQSAPRSSWFTSLARGPSYPWSATAQVCDTIVFRTLLFHYLPGGHVELSLMQKSDQVPAAMLLRACYAWTDIMPWAPVPVTFGMIVLCVHQLHELCGAIHSECVGCEQPAGSCTPQLNSITGITFLLVTSHARFVLCRPSSRHLGAYAAAFNFQPSASCQLHQRLGFYCDLDSRTWIWL